jgi:hypothetical protein
MGIPGIDRLGRELDEKWRAADYSSDAFPELAERALRDADLPAQISTKEIVKSVLGGVAVPTQEDLPGKFGQPPVTLYRASRFYIDALFWIDGTTTIHQHRFSGAFQVVVGSSIETLFGFETERTFDGHFALGTLQVSSANLLSRGDVRPIQSGPGLIHSIFHLERPSVSIVVRTFADPGSPPQFNYVRAGIARNPFFVDESVERKLQMVSMLKTTQDPDIEGLVGDLISHSDLHTAYRVVRECANLGSIDRLIDRVGDQPVAERLRRAVKDHRRETFIIGRRSVATDAEARFFLGVLLNASRRRDVLAITKQKKPAVDAARQIASWLRHLSTITAKLQVEGLPWQPNLLGLPEFDDHLEQACATVFSGQQPYGLDTNTATALAQLGALPALACLFDD